MSRIELNHWYMKENELLISLMRFYVKIKILKNDKTIYYQLLVKESEGKDLTFNFYTIEDAISFTEQTINKCQNTDEVFEKYTFMFENKMFHCLYPKKTTDKTSRIELTPEKVIQAIVEYFGEGKNYRVSAKEEISLCQDQIIIKFYLIEHLKLDGIKKDMEMLLTEEDLRTALNHYISFYDYDLLDFKYIGGIHKVGYYFDEDTPHYDGIQLEVKKRESVKSLSKTKKSED